VENNVPTLPVSASDVIMSNSEVLEENIATFLPTVPNMLSTFTTNVLADKPQNYLFNYFSEDGSDPIVSVFNNSGTDVIFNINKKSNLLRVGGCKNWISTVSVGGKNLNLYGRDFISLFTNVSATNVSITLDNLTFTGRKAFPTYVNDINKDITISRGLRISNINSNLLFHLPNDTIVNNTSPNMITIPYGTDLTNFGTRLEALEGGSESLTVDNIKTINPYLGIDEYYTLG
jgi:hypothetical protein